MSERHACDYENLYAVHDPSQKNELHNARKMFFLPCNQLIINLLLISEYPSKGEIFLKMIQSSI